MKISQQIYTPGSGWKLESGNSLIYDADLVIVFGSRGLLEDKSHFDTIKSSYPDATILLNSTSGEILSTRVYDDSLCLTAIKFEKTDIKSASINVKDFQGSSEAGEFLGKALPHEKLVHLFVISDGQKVNGTKLVQGIESVLPASVSVTGGLAGDAGNFEKTLVGLDSYPEEGVIAAIGFYGSNLTVGYGSRGGWDAFGPVRQITKSKDNVLFELDGKSALKLYKTYLGEKASELPGSALLFPLSLQTTEDSEPVVRTVLAINEEDESMTFAGDVPEGAITRFMKANFDRLIDGASTAASNIKESTLDSEPEFAILISCVGRKLVLGQRIEEEVEAVSETLGSSTVLTGFYSYGEISPFNPSVKCELHNQTMTITSFREV